LFAASASTDLVLLGGYVYPRTGVSLGPYANEMLTRLNVRRTVLSVSGVTQRGYYNNNLLLVETERAMIAATEEVIVVADSSKFGHQSLAALCGLGDVQHVVVDDGIDDAWRKQIVAAGVTLHVATTAIPNPANANPANHGASAASATSPDPVSPPDVLRRTSG
jgi:DeoR/GlpR family transcriptional regulator of sugar metabolism